MFKFYLADRLNIIITRIKCFIIIFILTFFLLSFSGGATFQFTTF